MIRFILMALVIISTGCGVRTARNEQAAADAIAGVEAATMATRQGKPEVTISILDGTTKYIEAAVDTPRADLPRPSMRPSDIVADPVSYSEKAPEPQPWGNGLVAGITAAGLAALFGIRRIAPAVPGLGPVVGMVADVAWDFLSHKDQKAAEQAQKAAADAAATIAPLARALVDSPNIPPEIKSMMTMDVLAAIHRISNDAGSRK